MSETKYEHQKQPRLPKGAESSPDWELFSIRAPKGFGDWFRSERTRRGVLSKALIRDMWDLYERLYATSGKRSWEE